MNRKVITKKIGSTKSYRVFLNCPTCEDLIVLDKDLFKKKNETIFCNKCKSTFATILTDKQKQTMLIKSISLHEIKRKKDGEKSGSEQSGIGEDGEG
jgi:Zn finger protein HypA/HybF involved in hydrogenase expression